MMACFYARSLGHWDKWGLEDTGVSITSYLGSGNASGFIMFREWPRTQQIHLPLELLCVKGCWPPARSLQHRGTGSLFLVRTLLSSPSEALCIYSEDGMGPIEAAWLRLGRGRAVVSSISLAKLQDSDTRLSEFKCQVSHLSVVWPWVIS